MKKREYYLTFWPLADVTTHKLTTSQIRDNNDTRSITYTNVSHVLSAAQAEVKRMRALILQKCNGRHAESGEFFI